MHPSASTQNHQTPQEQLAAEAAARSNAMMEKELKRAEALKRRQEAESKRQVKQIEKRMKNKRK